MTKILILAYYFPPIGGGGVQRVVKFVKYLPQFGYKPIVVTGPIGGSSDLWAPEDGTLGAEIPPEAELHRVPGPEPHPPGRWRRRADRLLSRPSAFDRWWVEGAVDVGRSVGADAALVFGELVPYITGRAAARLARELGKPLVADLQDPWALDEMWLYPSFAHRLLDRREMRRVLCSASAVVMNTPEAAVRVQGRFPELAPDFVTSIPNGYDAEDFVGEPPARSDRKFRIVHSGYLYTRLGLEQERLGGRLRKLIGGMPVPEVQFLTRSHVFLLEAVGRLLRSDPSLRSVLEVHFAGVLTEFDREVAARSPVVRLHGYLDHASTLDLVRTADLLFLPMQDLPAGMRAGLVPGKTYEYLGSGRPLLAAVPDGDVRDLLAEAGHADVCRPGDVAAMAELISARIAAWRAGPAPAVPNAEVVRRYERKHQTEELVRVFSRVLGEQESPVVHEAAPQAGS